MREDISVYKGMYNIPWHGKQLDRILLSLWLRCILLFSKIIRFAWTKVLLIPSKQNNSFVEDKRKSLGQNTCDCSLYDVQIAHFKF